MKPQEGKLFLQDCLDQCHPNLDIDNLIIYKYANNSVDEFHGPGIPTAVNEEEFDSHLHAKYVVKFLRYDNAFVAWEVSIGRGNGQYPVSKRQVTDSLMSNAKTQCVYVLHKAHAVVFKREVESVNEFIEKYLLKEHEQ